MSNKRMLSTLSQGNTLQQYLTEIYSIPMLTEQEEAHYVRQWCEFRDVSAAHKLVLSHLRLVVKIAMKFKSYGTPILDLISEGNIGLMRAVQKFDLKFSCRVATYAMLWIKATIQEYILKSWSLLKIKTNSLRKKLFYNTGEIKNKISIISGYEPSDKAMHECEGEEMAFSGASSDADVIVDEIDEGTEVEKFSPQTGRYDNSNSSDAEDNMYYHEPMKASESIFDLGNRVSGKSLGLSESEEVMIATSRNALSLSSPISHDIDISLGETIEDDRDNQESENIQSQEYLMKRKVLTDAMANLSERELDIFKSRKLTNKPLTLDVLSEKYKISRERIRQIEESVMKKIRNFARSTSPLLISN